MDTISQPPPKITPAFDGGALDDPTPADALAEMSAEDYDAAFRHGPANGNGQSPAPAENLPERVAGGLHPIGAEAGLANLAELRPYVIENVLRETETAGLVSASKAGKTFFALLLAICVALGRAFLDTFATAQGRILYIDCELHPETFWRRVAAIASALGVIRDTIYPSFELLSLRGRDTDLLRLGSFFRGIPKGAYRLIVIDGFYRLMPQGFDENSNSDMTKLWNLLDAYAAVTGAAILVIHHASKGDQSQKSITDVGSGAGAQSRAPDSHMVLRAHEQDDAAVLDGAVRSSPPLNPLCVRWGYPLWELAPDLSPDDLRKPGGRRRKVEAEAPPEQKSEPWTVERFAAAFATGEPQAKELILARAVQAGITEREAGRLLLLAAAERHIFEHPPIARKPRYATREPELSDVSHTHARIPPHPPSGGKRRVGAGGARARARKKAGDKK